MMLVSLLPFQFCAAGVGHWSGSARAVPGAEAAALRVLSLFPTAGLQRVPGCRLIGVGQDEDPQPLVRGAHLCRAEQARRRRVAHAPKLSQDGLEPKGDVAGDVFEEDPFGLAFPDDAGHIGPEMPGILGAAAFAGGAERLAGISGEDDVEGAAEGAGIEVAQVGPDRGRSEVSRMLRCDEDSAWPALPFDEGAGVIAGLGQHEAQIKASAACAEGESVPGT